MLSDKRDDPPQAVVLALESKDLGLLRQCERR
jgi:hypothetical protein